MWESNSPTPALEPEVPAAVIQDATDSSSSQREGDPDVSDQPTNCWDSVEFLSKLVAALRQSVHQGIPAELDPDTPPVALPEVGALLRHMGSTKEYIDRHSLFRNKRNWDGVLFMWPIGIWGQPVLSCGHRFSFLGWSVDFREGQYRVMWPTIQQGDAD